MPSSAFGASLTSSVIDVDKYQANLPGSYSDDALYIGYTRGEPVATPTDWNKGGVLRLLTYNQFSPANWSVSKILDGIGPVASTVTRLQDKTKHNVWLYFGTGRYFTKTDDPTNVQSLFGIKDPCFSETGRPDDYKGSFGSPCTTSLSATSSGTTGVTAGSGTTLVNQTSAVSTVPASANGWFINLAAQAGSSNAERVVTDTVASINGIITFSTFKPSVDTCSYGGTSSVWSVKFDNGGDTLSGLKGQILIQLSTGAFQQVDAGSAFTKSLNRQSDDYKGVPPKIQPAITTNSNHTPSRRILHIQER
ncbi:MAG: hypothetical protein HXX17_10960 [Geobacteraceae bacterium]|nr:hypothetical protein [Geobacteraceae bacterium]